MTRQFALNARLRVKGLPDGILSPTGPLVKLFESQDDGGDYLVDISITRASEGAAAAQPHPRPDVSAVFPRLSK